MSDSPKYEVRYGAKNDGPKVEHFDTKEAADKRAAEVDGKVKNLAAKPTTATSATKPTTAPTGTGK